MKLTLPIPPSVNACYATNWKTKRRFKSKRYEAWEAEARLVLICQRRNADPMMPQYITGPVAVDYRIGRPDKRKRDLGNLEKPLSDFLVSAGLIQDDSLIMSLHLEWGDNEGADITITEVK